MDWGGWKFMRCLRYEWRWRARESIINLHQNIIQNKLRHWIRSNMTIKYAPLDIVTNLRNEPNEDEAILSTWDANNVPITEQRNSISSAFGVSNTSIREFLRVNIEEADAIDIYYPTMYRHLEYAAALCSSYGQQRTWSLRESSS